MNPNATSPLKGKQTDLFPASEDASTSVDSGLGLLSSDSVLVAPPPMPLIIASPRPCVEEPDCVV